MLKIIQIIFSKIFKSKKLFEFQPFIHLDVYNNPTINETNKKLMLPKIIFKEFSKDKASKKAIEYIKNNYPHLKGKINIK